MATRDDKTAIVDIVTRQPGIDYLGIAQQLNLRLRLAIDSINEMVREGAILAVEFAE